MSKLTTVVCFAVITMATHRLEAALIISVEEDTVNNEINFSWNGIIGDSGAGIGINPPPYPYSVGADFVSTVEPLFYVADRSRGDVDDGGVGFWQVHERYAGQRYAIGSGGSFSSFVVTGNTPWAVDVVIDGNVPHLAVGSVTDGGSDHPNLATHTFSGSFTLTGSFATYGLFNIVSADISAGPVTLWSATTGSGLIVFQNAAVVPEPSTFLTMLCGMALLGVTSLRRRRRRGAPII